MAKLFPAKILLAGEYTVIHGGHALAIPFLSYGGRWSSLSNGLENRMLDIYQALIKSRSSLPWLDFKTWYSEIHLGKYFSSNIPEGYGLGSSGALCAGIYETYLTDEQSITLTELKKRLATLENVFHGHSSGLDPLVSFVQRPIVASTGGITSRDNIFDRSWPTRACDCHYLRILWCRLFFQSRNERRTGHSYGAAQKR